MRQVFAIWFIPFYRAEVQLVTVLSLLPSSGRTGNNSGVNENPGDTIHYFISRQENHYQVNEFLKFVLPGVGPLFWLGWQLVALLFVQLRFSEQSVPNWRFNESRRFRPDEETRSFLSFSL